MQQKSCAALAKSHQIKRQIKIIKFYTKHPDLKAYLNNNWKIHTLYYTYSTYLINYWEGFFFTSFKNRTDRNIYTCIRLYMLMGIEINF